MSKNETFIKFFLGETLFYLEFYLISGPHSASMQGPNVLSKVWLATED